MDIILIGYLGISFILLVALYCICRMIDHHYTAIEAAQRHEYVRQDIHQVYRETKRLSKDVTKSINDNLYRMVNEGFGE